MAFSVPAPASAQRPAATRDLPRGHVLEAGDIEHATASREEDDAALPAPGWVTRRMIRSGELLRAPAVVPPPLVARGDTVTVNWRVAGIRIARKGVALGDGFRGDTLLVRVGALHRVRAVAKGPSIVDVP